MAAENDDAKPGGEEERRSGRDRRRPRLTIDLTASSVSAKGQDEASSPEPPHQADAGPSVRETAARLFPNFASLTSSGLSREAWVGFGSAAALGGVVALVLLILLQAIGIVPAPGVVAARDAADQARATANSLSQIDRRLTAVETMTENLPGFRSDVAALTTRVANLEQAVGAVPAKGDVEAVRTDLAAIKTRLDQTASPATAADLTALSARVGRLETNVAAAGAVAPAAPGPAAVPPGDVDNRIASLSARLDADEAAIGRLSATAATNSAAEKGAAMAALRSAVDAGRPFPTELGMLNAFGADPVATALKPYAASGIATRAILETDFAKVSDAILAATQGSGDDSLFGRIAAGTRGLVSIRPAGPVPGNDPAAIVSRMTADVAAGDLAKALSERDALPAAGKDASSDWAGRAQARLTADTAFAPASAATPAGKG
jgi:hypothetical protein